MNHSDILLPKKKRKVWEPDRLMVKDQSAKINYVLVWLTETNTYLPSMPENHTSLSAACRSNKHIKKGDHIKLKGGLAGRILFIGSLNDCQNAERNVERYVEEHVEEQIQSSAILEELEADDGSSDEEPRSSEFTSWRAAENVVVDNQSIGAKLNERISVEKQKARLVTSNISSNSQAESSSLVPSCSEDSLTRVSGKKISCSNSSEILRKILECHMEGNKFMKKMTKQQSEIIVLLKTICQENLPMTSCDVELKSFTDINGNTFYVTELSHLNPNAFAISFMRKMYGDQFKDIILDPSGPTCHHVVPAHIMNLLKTSLSENFHSFLYSKIRKSVNQASRDARNKQR